MFELYGEFDSSEGINQKAKELKEAGDMAGVYALAAENGIDTEDAADFIDEAEDTLTTPLSAATGKLRAEAKHLELSGILMDWVEELIELCIDNTQMRTAVRKKGKDLAGFIALTAETGYKNRCIVKQEIVKRTAEVQKILGGHEFSIGIPDKAERKRIAVSYYLEAEK